MFSLCAETRGERSVRTDHYADEKEFCTYIAMADEGVAAWKDSGRPLASAFMSNPGATKQEADKVRKVYNEKFTKGISEVNRVCTIHGYRLVSSELNHFFIQCRAFSRIKVKL